MNEIEVMEFLTNIGKAAKEASMTVSHLGQLKKNKVLVDAANLLRKYTDDILSANAQDLQKAKEENMPEGLQDRDSLEKLRKEIEGSDITTPDGIIKVTVSMGAATDKGDLLLEKVINRADDCLYDAKRTGRNKVVWEQ